MSNFDRAQRAYDNAVPPDYWDDNSWDDEAEDDLLDDDDAAWEGERALRLDPHGEGPCNK